MKVRGKNYRSIWEDEAGNIQIIDQRRLPHKFVIETLNTVDDFVTAIRDMHLRGAPLIGVAAAYATYIAVKESASAAHFENHLKETMNKIKSTRPTANNLFWAIDEVLFEISKFNSINEKINSALNKARELAEQDVESCRLIGEHGLKIIQEISEKKNGDTVNILTHCNAGWLATVDYGTATAPIYIANEKGIKLHVWVDETRPRNQGAKLTAWEFAENGIPHTVIVDNAGGHLMQKGLVDLVLVGTDRTTYTGDVTNKIGTYLKALAAYDNNVPFYVALPSSSFDWETAKGKDIQIELRDADEVRFVDGLYNGEIVNVLVAPENSPALNIAFDVTPARLVTALITERGICQANKESILSFFPERKKLF
jgi:methylthioribose-1-phosphate isomerase